MIKRSIIILILCLEVTFTYSQFSAYGSDSYKELTTEYSADTIQDPIFVFNGKIGDEFTGSVLYTPKDTGFYNFKWFTYNSGTNTFDSIDTDLNRRTSIYTDSLARGIQVVLYQDTTYIDTFTCWIFFNRLDIVMDIPSKLCSGIKIVTNISHEPDNFTYYEEATGSSHILGYRYFINWKYETIDDPGGFETEMGITVPGDLEFFDYSPPLKDEYEYYDDNPPPIDIKYTATVSDSFNNSVYYEYDYESIHTFARYTVDIWDSWKLADTTRKPRNDNLNSAPAEGRFTNKSKNGAKFEWTFISQTADSSLADYYIADGIEINKTVYDTTPRQDFMYYYSGYYKAVLVSTAENGVCTDTFPDFDDNPIDFDVEILIDNSEFKGNGGNVAATDDEIDNNTDDASSGDADIPNAIILDNSTYDLFRIRNISLCYVKIDVYDRWGRNVYSEEFMGNIDEEWPGWTGVDKSGSKLSVGTYYYVMEAHGCETEPIHYVDSKKKKVNGQRPIKKYSGPIYIFNEHKD